MQRLTVRDAQLVSDETARNAANSLAASLGDWVDAMHWYRHGQNTEMPAHPPFDLAMTLLSQGAAYLRWLITLDQKRLLDA